MYGLTNNSSILKLKFDGDLLEDRQTPEQLAMEDEDMIDVTVGNRWIIYRPLAPMIVYHGNCEELLINAFLYLLI
jgi:hypothetical protein